MNDIAWTYLLCKNTFEHGLNQGGKGDNRCGNLINIVHKSMFVSTCSWTNVFWTEAVTSLYNRDLKTVNSCTRYRRHTNLDNWFGHPRRHQLLGSSLLLPRRLVSLPSWWQSVGGRPLILFPFLKQRLRYDCLELRCVAKECLNVQLGIWNLSFDRIYRHHPWLHTRYLILCVGLALMSTQWYNENKNVVITSSYVPWM